MSVENKLFQEFPPVSTEQWEEVILKDLKGADYQKKLVWRTDEGFQVRPYYRAEDLEALDYLEALPNQFPYTRGFKTENNKWNIVQEITERDPKKANEIAVNALKKGADTLSFCTKNITSYKDLTSLLHQIDLEKNPVQFRCATSYIDLMKWFMQYVEEHKLDKAKIAGAIDFDAIIYALKKGKFYRNKETDLQEAIELLVLTSELPHFKIINVNGLAMHNAGATIVQELGYVLAVANEYVAFATEKGVASENIASKMQFTLSVGSNYFMEIAKLRAVRLLWSTLIEQYHPACDCAYHVTINTIASSWNKTLYDPYVNMLRSTTEAMSAALGGADSIALKPFDVAYKQGDEFSSRMSRNVQIILKEESYFDKVVDPAAGSYYIENLTNAIIEYAWSLFRETEIDGGFITLIENGKIRSEIERSAQKRDMDIATRKYILLGTNQYPNTNESMLDKIEETKTCDSEGLKSYRGAAAFEALRLQTEAWAKKHHRPKVFLLKVGNLAMRQARAGFITNFFGCAGYEIIDNAGFASAEEGVKAALNAQPDLIVLCSSDEEYATLGIEITQQIKKNTKKIPVLIAGNPTEIIDTLNEAGVDDYIHVKNNVLEKLSIYNNLLFSPC
ncbi:MAG: methylmalonyl-CoA mutase family protein [Bacteroidetes bacterium]|nr:methylmalonyl-CoA mutase family protein [Bacteroidota bacterium]MCL2302638.1 methylmalonyl-CoA mutase family protein [Lentimicrobiaceae bacterium]